MFTKYELVHELLFFLFCSYNALLATIHVVKGTADGNYFIHIITLYSRTLLIFTSGRNCKYHMALIFLTKYSTYHRVWLFCHVFPPIWWRNLQDRPSSRLWRLPRFTSKNNLQKSNELCPSKRLLSCKSRMSQEIKEMTWKNHQKASGNETCKDGECCLKNKKVEFCEKNLDDWLLWELVVQNICKWGNFLDPTYFSNPTGNNHWEITLLHSWSTILACMGC